ncbi:hypothetical protein D9757_008375 [Collybiopsis confluens]|uniref:Uncharacterized protein n=1 Tax=Collybiopsis confluens TaxID=2823264 RepID=A0A8H5M756_9AGAR|nr:hypothetical protein D9757_008375 [Collybiopsis confluens]
MTRPAYYGWGPIDQRRRESTGGDDDDDDNDSEGEAQMNESFANPSEYDYLSSISSANHLSSSYLSSPPLQFSPGACIDWLCTIENVSSDVDNDENAFFPFDGDEDEADGSGYEGSQDEGACTSGEYEYDEDSATPDTYGLSAPFATVDSSSLGGDNAYPSTIPLDYRQSSYPDDGRGDWASAAEYRAQLPMLTSFGSSSVASARYSLQSPHHEPQSPAFIAYDSSPESPTFTSYGSSGDDGYYYPQSPAFTIPESLNSTDYFPDSLMFSSYGSTGEADCHSQSPAFTAPESSNGADYSPELPTLTSHDSTGEAGYHPQSPAFTACSYPAPASFGSRADPPKRPSSPLVYESSSSRVQGCYTASPNSWEMGAEDYDDRDVSAPPPPSNPAPTTPPPITTRLLSSPIPPPNSLAPRRVCACAFPRAFGSDVTHELGHPPHF